ncbi:hypothetical protein JW823_10340 [bacterium]|nr:hypothetical protein [candidate division CSSED10-310 bacterium]
MKVMSQFVKMIVLILLSILAVLCIINSFAGHFTPDTSVYLLHTRTFTETLDRFTLSHDLKGILICFFLAPAVLLFGASMPAAALTHMMVILIGCGCMFALVYSHVGRLGAFTLVLLTICTAYSSVLWGGNARPEDFAFGLISIVLLGAARGSSRWLFTAGICAACCLFLKTTLVMSPVALLLAGCILPDVLNNSEWSGTKSRMRHIGGKLLACLLGFGLATLIVLTWITLFDSPAGFYRQCIEWPAEYRDPSFPGIFDLCKSATLFNRVHLDILLIVAVLGLVRGYMNNYRRLITLCCVLIVSEYYRIAFEGSQWPYSLIICLTPMMIGSSLLFTDRQMPALPRFLRVIPPLLCLVPIILITFFSEAQAFNYRVVQHMASPYEYLADKMREYGYRQGDSVLIAGVDFSIILLLEAPRPYPVFAFNYSLISDAERDALLQHYTQHIPTWVVRENPRLQLKGMQVLGGRDDAYHVVVAADEKFLQNQLIISPGDTISPILPNSAFYKNMLDAGSYQIWHIQKSIN